MWYVTMQICFIDKNCLICYKIVENYFVKHIGRLRYLTDVADDHIPLASGFKSRLSYIWRVFNLLHWLINFRNCSAQLTSHMHECGHKNQYYDICQIILHIKSILENNYFSFKTVSLSISSRLSTSVITATDSECSPE